MAQLKSKRFQGMNDQQLRELYESEKAARSGTSVGQPQPSTQGGQGIEELVAMLSKAQRPTMGQGIGNAISILGGGTPAKREGTSLGDIANLMKIQQMQNPSEYDKAKLRKTTAEADLLEKAGKGQGSVSYGPGGITSYEGGSIGSQESTQDDGLASVVSDYEKQNPGFTLEPKDVAGPMGTHRVIMVPKKKDEKGMLDPLSEQRFMEQYGRSLKELEGFDKNITSTGPTGFVARTGARISEALDQLPETGAMLRELKPRANMMARQIEGGRITNEDRQVYADAMTNALVGSGEENIRLASNKLIEMHDKGGDITGNIRMLQNSGIPQLQKIAQIVTQSIPSISSGSTNQSDTLSRLGLDPNRFELVGEE